MMAGGDFEHLTQRLLAFRAERNWEQFHNPKDQLLSLCLEAAEALELAQWRQGEDLQQHLLQHKSDLADELVDVLNWVLLIAHDQNIDLRSAFDTKLAKNTVKYPVDAVRGSAKKYTAYRSKEE